MFLVQGLRSAVGTGCAGVGKVVTALVPTRMRAVAYAATELVTGAGIGVLLYQNRIFSKALESFIQCCLDCNNQSGFEAKACVILPAPPHSEYQKCVHDCLSEADYAIEHPDLQEIMMTVGTSFVAATIITTTVALAVLAAQKGGKAVGRLIHSTPSRDFELLPSAERQRVTQLV